MQPINRSKEKCFLSEITTDDELYQRCINRAMKALTRFNTPDRIWLEKWLPIIKRKENESKDKEINGQCNHANVWH